MGNSQPEYQYMEQGELYPSFDSFSQFQLYKISIPSNLVLFYEDWYEDRLQRNTPFVRIIDYNPESKGCATCSTSENLTVYTERLFFLDQLSLSYPEAIFFLKECLTTLDYLYDEFGVFRVKGGMVGVNHKGKVKVWVNENFAQNLPEEQTEYLDEEDTVCDLVDMIQEATEDYRFTRIIEGYAGSLTFANTIKVLNMMQSQEGLVVNKIYLDLQEYQTEMTKAIQAKTKQSESLAQTYHEAPPPAQTYEIHGYPQQYYIETQTIAPPPVLPKVQYHYTPSPARPRQIPLHPSTTLSATDPHAHNPYEVLKLYQPPPQQVHRQAQPQGIQRMNKNQRAQAPSKLRSPKMNIVNRPVIEKLPVTEVDMRKLEVDIQKKQNQMKLKQKLQDNYNQIPQVQSVIVVMEEEDRTRKHLDKLFVPRNPITQAHHQPPALKSSPQSPQQIPTGRPGTNPKQPMSIKQMNFQSEIFTLF